MKKLIIITLITIITTILSGCSDAPLLKETATSESVLIQVADNLFWADRSGTEGDYLFDLIELNSMGYTIIDIVPIVGNGGYSEMTEALIIFVEIK